MAGSSSTYPPTLGPRFRSPARLDSISTPPTPSISDWFRPVSASVVHRSTPRQTDPLTRFRRSYQRPRHAKTGLRTHTCPSISHLPKLHQPSFRRFETSQAPPPGPPHKPLGQIDRPLTNHLPIRDHLVHQSDRFRPLGTDQPRVEHQRPCHTRRQVRTQKRRRYRRGYPQLRDRISQLRTRVGHHHVRTAQQRTSTRDRSAVRSDHDRDPEPAHRSHHPRQPGQQRVESSTPWILRAQPKIEPCAEHAPLAAEHDAPCVPVLDAPERRFEIRQHLGRQGVATIRSVQRDDRDRPRAVRNARAAMPLHPHRTALGMVRGRHC